VFLKANNASSIKAVIDGFTSGILTGWVYDSTLFEQSLHFYIEVDGKVITHSVANHYREDLVAAGFDNGKHAFEVNLGLTYEQTAGKLIRLLDKYQQPIKYAELIVDKPENTVTFSLINQTEHHFNFLVNSVNAFVNAPLSLNYGSVCISLISVNLTAGENTLQVIIPLDIIDGLHDSFSIEFIGDPAPVWIAQRLKALSNSLTKDAISDETTIDFAEHLRHKSLDLQCKHASKNNCIDTAMSAYRYLMNENDPVSLRYENTGIDVDVSIFVNFGVYHSHEDFLSTVASILLAFNHSQFELIIVVEHETKVSLDDLLKANNINCNLVLVYKTVNFNELFSAFNAEAKGAYSVFINEPIEVTSWWLDELVEPFNQVVNTPDITTPKHASLVGETLIPFKFMDINGVHWNTEQRVHSNDPVVCYSKKENKFLLSVWCVKTAFFNELQKGNNKYSSLSSLNVNSLSYAREIGLNIIYSPQAEVIAINGLPIIPPKLSPIEGDKKKRILLIDHAVPSIKEDAGSYAAIQEIKLIQSLGFDVIFADLQVKYHPKKTILLQKMGVEILYAPFVKSLSAAIEIYAPKVCAVYITRYNVAEKVLPIIKKINAAIPILFNNADLHFLRELRMALRNKDLKSIENAVITRDRELAVMHQVDAVLSYTEVEQAVIVSHLLESSKVHSCPWVLEDKMLGCSFEDREGIAFLGGYQHKPNIEAVTFFVEQVAPLLLVKAPEIIFSIYGSHLPDFFHDFGLKNIKIIGFVEHLDDLYQQHRVFVAPLLSGAGIKGKVLEALAYGLPTVLSSIAAEGIGLSHNLTTLQAETPEQWCDEIIRLYNDKKLWLRISQNQKVLAQDQYSFSAGKQKMQTIFSSVGLLEYCN
jgi:glycosyltransferase involved in cell wall biosynthesis